MKDDDVAALDRLQLVNKLIDEDSLLVLETGKHAGAFDANRLIKEDDKEGGKKHRQKQVASPTPKHPRTLAGRRRRLRLIGIDHLLCASHIIKDQISSLFV